MVESNERETSASLLQTVGLYADVVYRICCPVYTDVHVVRSYADTLFVTYAFVILQYMYTYIKTRKLVTPFNYKSANT